MLYFHNSNPVSETFALNYILRQAQHTGDDPREVLAYWRRRYADEDARETLTDISRGEIELVR